MKKLEYILLKFSAGKNSASFSQQETRIIAALTLFALMALTILTGVVYQLYINEAWLGFNANITTTIMIILILIYFRISGNLSHYKTAITSLAGLFFLYLAATGGFKNTGLFWCYIFPPLSFYVLGQRIGLIINFLVISGYGVIFFLPGFPFYIASYNPAYPFRFILSMIFATIVVLFLEYSREQAKQKQIKLIVELKAALAQVKTMSGLLPICTECKKIRNDSGYWDRLEEYLEKHSDAELTHSICEDCADKLYGDQKWYRKK